MNKSEAPRAKVAIGVMMAAFPSSQSNVTDETVAAYMMSVEDYDLDAVEHACRAFVKGEVRGRNNGFAPSGPELSAECQRQQDRLRWQEHMDNHEFIKVGTEDWRKVVAHRGSTPPAMVRDGFSGWFIPKLELAEARKLSLPKPMSAKEGVNVDIKRMASGDYE